MHLFTRLSRHPEPAAPPPAMAGLPTQAGDLGQGMSPGMRLRLAISGRPALPAARSLVDLDRRPDDVAWLIVRAISVRAA